MTSHKENKNSAKSDQKPSSPAPVEQYGKISDSDNSQTLANKTAQHRHTEENHTIIVNIIQPKSEDSSITKNGGFERWGVIVHAGIFVVTLILALVSVWQGCLTRHSISIADSVFKADTLYNFKNIKHQKTADSLAKKSEKYTDSLDSVKQRKSDVVFKVQDSALKAQITTVQENQKEFEIENKSYIEVKNFDTTSFRFDKVIRFYIINLGNRPAKIKYVKIKILVDTPYVKYQEINKLFKLKNPPERRFDLNYYINKENPLEQKIVYSFFGRDPALIYKYFIAYKFSIYFQGVLYYSEVDPISKKAKQYKFTDEVFNRFNTISYRVLNSENN